MTVRTAGRVFFSGIRRLAVKVAIVASVLLVGIFAVLWIAQDDIVFPVPARSLGEPTILQPGFRTARTDTGILFWAAPPAPGRPVIVHFHGNGVASDAAAVAMVPFHAAGYGVVLAEYRGYGGNPGKPSQAGLMEDGRAAVAWARREWPDAPIILWGESIGSSVATTIATEGGYEAVVLDSPFTSILDIAREAFPLMPIAPFLRSPFPSLVNAGRIDVPLFVLVGMRDRVVPPRHGFLVENAAGCRGGVSAHPELGHMVLDGDATGRVSKRVLTFLRAVEAGSFACLGMSRAASDSANSNR